MLRNKFSAFVNLLGLSIGIGSFILIALYVYDESKYDKFHENRGRIYRIHSNVFNPDVQMAQLPARFYEHLKEGLPEAEEITRVFSSNAVFNASHGDQTVEDLRDLYVEPAFLNMFSFDLLSGSVANFKENPYAAFLSKSVAGRLFEEDDPVGQTFSFEEYGQTFEFVVAGIFDDVPGHSHLQFDVLYNLEWMRLLNQDMFASWGNFSSTFYLMLREDAEAKEVSSKIHQIYASAINNEGFLDSRYSFHIQPLEEIYLGSAGIQTHLVVQSGSRSAIYIFSVSALLMLVLACLNYVNLSSARSVVRAREVGVRKVLGANRGRLVRSFLAESAVMTLLALVIGVVLAEIFLPSFNRISGKDLAIADGWPGMLLLVLGGLWVTVSVFSGTYPAFIMSRFQPVDVLKGHAFASANAGKYKSWMGMRFRQSLIVVQFAISIGLIASSLVLYQQIRHALSQTGFEKESLIVVNNKFHLPMRQVYEAFRNEMNQYPFVTNISAGTNVPTSRVGNQGRIRQSHQQLEEAPLVYFSPVDFGYFEALNTNMVAGRDLDRQIAADSTEAVILNETAARSLGVTDSIGVRLTGFWDGHDKRLIGIVEDIHFQSVHQEVLPTAFFVLHRMIYQPPASYRILVRFNAGHTGEVVGAIEQAWANASGGEMPADWFFMDERYKNLYRSELQTASLSRIMTLLSMLIACMGLIGTAFYVMESRKKEFGVRKVLGASMFSLSKMVSREFFLLIAAACLLAWPLSYYVMDRWLDNFAYRVPLSVWYFFISGMAALVLALVVSNALALNQARQNVLDSLRHE